MTQNSEASLSNRNLSGSIAIVTGGAVGIGEAIVKAFVAAGAKVIIADVRGKEGEAIAYACGPLAQFRHLDVGDAQGWSEMVRDVEAEHGAVDILVNNAGAFFYSPIEEVSLDALRKIVDVNLIGPSLGMSAVIPGMKRRRSGVIINISSVDGTRGAAGMSSYNATKWGLRGMTLSVVLETGPWNIRVNTILPGAIQTSMLNPEGLPRAELEALHPTIPMIRIGQSEEVAKAALFLASDDAAYISGAELSVDGGFGAGHYYFPRSTPMGGGESVSE